MGGAKQVCRELYRLLANYARYAIPTLLILPNFVFGQTYFFPNQHFLYSANFSGWYPIDLQITGIQTQAETIKAGLTDNPLISDFSPRSYDSSIQHDIRPYYKPHKVRIKSVNAHFSSDNDTWFLFGFDTGFSSEKIKVHPALYLGLLKKHEITRNSFVDYSFLLNIGGHIKDISCKDDYQREYYCGNLRAWRDFNRPRTQTIQAVQFRYSYFFY